MSFRTLSAQVAGVTAATAVVSVIITALVALPIAVRSANNQARAELVQTSALAVELLATERPAARERIVRQLRRDDIAVHLIRRGVADPPGLPQRVVDKVAAGTRTVDVHVAQVRAKLGGAATLIRTVRGVGYTADG